MVDDEPSDSQAMSTYAKAVNYKMLEERIMPAAGRTAAKYGGLHFLLKTVDLSHKFKLVHQKRLT